MLTKYEQETIVSWNNEDDVAEIYTCSKRVASLCKKRGYEMIAEDKHSATFKCPTRCITLRSPLRKGTKMTKKRLMQLSNARAARGQC